MCCGNGNGGGGGVPVVVISPPFVNQQGNVPLGALPTPAGGWPGLPAPSSIPAPAGITQTAGMAAKKGDPNATGASTALMVGKGSLWPFVLIGGLFLLAGAAKRRRKRS